MPAKPTSSPDIWPWLEAIRLLRSRRVSAGTWAFAALLSAAAAWVACLPWSERVQEATMRRYHLGASSFAAWALQQPVPSMYSFANQYRLFPAKTGWKIVDPRAQVIHGWVNHFPPRKVTFEVFDFGEPTWTGAWTSSYRGKSLETLCQITQSRDGLRIERLSERWDRRPQ